MGERRRVYKITSFVVALSLFVAMMPTQTLKAATLKWGKKNVTIYVGQKTTLKLKGVGKKKVKISTKTPCIIQLLKKTKKSVVVKGKIEGTALITAKIGKTKATCTVNVKEKDSSTPADPTCTPSAKPTCTPTPKPTATPTPTKTPKPTPTQTPKPVIVTPTPTVAPKYVDCPDCVGGIIFCPDCGGQGNPYCLNCVGGYVYTNGQRKLCPYCNGTMHILCHTCGGLGKWKCTKCAGQGRLLVQ